MIVASYLGDWNLLPHKICNNIDVYTCIFQQINHYGYYLNLICVCSFALFMLEKKRKLQILYLLSFTLFVHTSIVNDSFGSYLATMLTMFLFLFIYFINYIRYKKFNLQSNKEKSSLVNNSFIVNIPFKSFFIKFLIVLLIFTILSCFTKNKDGDIIAIKNLESFGLDILSIVFNITGTEVQDNLQSKLKSMNMIGTARGILWKNGINFIKDKPILGYGVENLESKYLPLGIDQDRPHNLLIQLATTSGIPGMLLYSIAVGIIVFRGFKLLNSTDNECLIICLLCVIAYLISAMFGNSMFYTSPYFFIFLGGLFGLEYMHFCNTKD